MKKIKIKEIADYYTQKLYQHGETPNGVDWNGKDSQIRRFEQLTKAISKPKGFSIADIGCGYGAYYDYLRNITTDFEYTGIDISQAMIEAARNRYKNTSAIWISGLEPPTQTDYSVASGIFNVRLSQPDHVWFNYIKNTLDRLNANSRIGFSFNCLTIYSDSERMRPHLYYADPCTIFDHCKRNYSKNIALLHDYDLFEFTIIVRK